MHRATAQAIAKLPRSLCLGLGLFCVLTTGCGLPSQLESPWRGNTFDQNADPAADPFKPAEPAGDGGPAGSDGGLSTPEDAGSSGSCGDGQWLAGEACDSSADDRFPCGADCRLVSCDLENGQGGDKRCVDFGEDVVCVRYEGASVCLPQVETNAPLVDENQLGQLYTYCSVQRGDGWEPVAYHHGQWRACHPDHDGIFNDSGCRDGSPESNSYRCHTFDQPPEHRALVLEEDLQNHSLLPIPKWRVLKPDPEDVAPIDLLMACVPDHEDFCRFGHEPSLQSWGLRPKCSGTARSNQMVMEAVDQDEHACVLAECLVEDVESCLDDFPIVNPTCSDNGRCLADIESAGRNAYLRGLQQDLYHRCTEACSGEANPIDFYQNCWAEGDHFYPHPDGGVTGPDLRCATCDECDRHDTLACWPRENGNDICSPPCGQETDCPHGGACRQENGVSLCVSIGGQSGGACDQEQPCAPHETCESGRCVPRPCDQDNRCPEGNRCNDQNRCEPNQGGGLHQPSPQRCTPPSGPDDPNPCLEQQYCNHVWDSDEQGFDGEAVCSGGTCHGHNDCAFGQYCLRHDDQFPGYCSIWTGCQHFRPDGGQGASGEECFHGHQFCIPIGEMRDRLAPLASDRCVMHVGCDEDASCRAIAQDARCASRSCVRMGPCGNIDLPARSFPGICLDSIDIDGNNDAPNSPNQWRNDLVKTVADQWSEQLHALDRDAFFFEAPFAGNFRFSAVGLNGDPWCRLFEVQTLHDGHVWVNPQAIQGDDGGVPDNGNACALVENLSPNERVVFLVEPADLSFGFGGMDYTLFIETVP